MLFRSIHKYARISPYKVRRLAKVLRKRPYTELMAYLKVLPHSSARILTKVSQSAAANALVKDAKLDESMLYVKNIVVNEGPRAKRIWRRGRGRADMLLKRSCHVLVELEDRLEKEKKE